MSRLIALGTAAAFMAVAAYHGHAIVLGLVKSLILFAEVTGLHP